MRKPRLKQYVTTCKPKSCKECNTFLPVPRPVGQRYCSTCSSIVRRRAVNNIHAKRKQETFNAYGNICCCCGETEPAFLTVDHINGDGSSHRKEIGSGGKAIYYWLYKNHYPLGFQLLCWNCNLAKYHNGNICPHKQ